MYLGATKRGFSLIEAMVAVLLFSITIGIAFEIVSRSTRTQLSAGQYADAIALAEGWVGAFPTQSLGSSNPPPYAIQLQVREIDGEERALNSRSTRLVEVVADVSWETQATQRKVRLASWRVVSDATE